ncbi:MAG: DNA cytosine methyltransferase [Bullifex sp.]
MLLRREIVGAVECEKYQREILLSRQTDGILPRFPVWDDVTTFRVDNRETEEYIGWLKEISNELCICGGFPCQDISVAGKRKGIEGERSGLWSEMFRIIGEIRPAHVFVENSSALIVRGFDRVLGDLTSIGYDCRWVVVGADDVGAPHKRKRFWLIADRGGEDSDTNQTRHERICEGANADEKRREDKA